MDTFSAVNAAVSEVSTEAVSLAHIRKMLPCTWTAKCRFPEEATKSAAFILVLPL